MSGKDIGNSLNLAHEIVKLWYLRPKQPNYLAPVGKILLVSNVLPVAGTKSHSLEKNKHSFHCSRAYNTVINKADEV